MAVLKVCALMLYCAHDIVDDVFDIMLRYTSL